MPSDGRQAQIDTVPFKNLRFAAGMRLGCPDPQLLRSGWDSDGATTFGWNPDMSASGDPWFHEAMLWIQIVNESSNSMTVSLQLNGDTSGTDYWYDTTGAEGGNGNSFPLATTQGASGVVVQGWVDITGGVYRGGTQNLHVNGNRLRGRNPGFNTSIEYLERGFLGGSKYNKLTSINVTTDQNATGEAALLGWNMGGIDDPNR